jgi:hypothetical protein
MDFIKLDHTAHCSMLQQIVLVMLELLAPWMEPLTKAALSAVPE